MERFAAALLAGQKLTFGNRRIREVIAVEAGRAWVRVGRAADDIVAVSLETLFPATGASIRPETVALIGG